MWRIGEIGGIFRCWKGCGEPYHKLLNILLSELYPFREKWRTVTGTFRLRESGSVEQDADVILFLYREAYYEKETDNHSLEIIVSKNRNGPMGSIAVNYGVVFSLRSGEGKKDYSATTLNIIYERSELNG
jgi:hypothetical protein